MKKNKHSWNWNGGRTISQHGYILLFVGKGEHLADVRGYAYEHRIVLEKKLGRPLEYGEKTHHINGDKKDNRPENLDVVSGNSEHWFRHRKVNSELRKPGELNIKIKCRCGCGKSFLKFDDSGRPRKFITGHNTILEYKKGERYAPKRKSMVG